MVQESCLCWLVAKEIGEKPPEEEKPAELYPTMGLAQKRTRKDLFEVCVCCICVYFLGSFGALACYPLAINSWLRHTQWLRVFDVERQFLILLTHIHKPKYIFQLSMGMVRTQDIPAERELSQSQSTKTLVSHEVECISFVQHACRLRMERVS